MATPEGCDEIFKEGIRYTFDFKEDPLSKESHNCKIKSTDGEFVLVILPYELETIQKFLRSIPKYNEKTLRHDGIYTWILYSTAEAPDSILFVAVETKSALEVGTLHRAIGLGVNAHKIYGGGELRKTGNKIEYNTLSGTYVNEWLQTRQKKRYCPPEELEETIQKKFRELFTGFDLILNSTTFIVNALPILPKDLEEYRRAGFVVETFDNDKDCKARPREIYRQLRKTSGGKRRPTRRQTRRQRRKQKVL